MKKWITTIAMVGIALAGCNQPTVQEAKVQAYQRWYHTRAQILCNLGTQQLEVGQLERAQAKAQEALALDENYADARILLSKVYIEQGRYGSAVSELNRAIEISPASAEAFYLLGVAQEKDRNLEQALASYRKSQELDPTGVSGGLAATEVLVLMGRLDEAKSQIEAYVTTGCDEPGAFELAGRVAMAQGKYAKAVKYYQQAHDLDFQNVRYAELLAGAQFAAGMHESAARSIARLTESKDYQPGAWVFVMLGDCHMARGRHLDARDAYCKASELAPKSPHVWMSLAKATLAVGDTRRAVISARHAAYLDGNSPEASMLLGYALLRDGQGNEALSVLNKAAARHPDSAMLQCLIGRAHEAVGDARQARHCYGQALRLDGDNALARQLASAEKGIPKVD